MTKLSDIIAAMVGRPKENPETVALPVKGEVETAEDSIEVSPLKAQERSSEEEPETSSIEITQEFEKAFDTISKRAPFIFITGRAGTGKSTFTLLLKETLKSYAVVAPTGVAALNIGGQTIHSFFRIAPGPIDFEKIKPLKHRIAYKALKTLIIDEISMVRADLLDAIDHMLRANGPNPNEPFGGVQVVAIGDLFQLPPIVATEEEQALLTRGYSSSFFFGALVLKKIKIEVIEFTKVFRQTEESFIQLLNSIREGKGLERTLEALNKRVAAVDEKSFDGVVLTGTNAAASRINASCLEAINAPPMYYKGEIIGDLRIEQSKLPAPFDLELKRGAQVMFLKNDKKRRWVNGTLGIVKECNLDNVVVHINDHLGPREVRVEQESWENLKYEYSAEENAVVATKVGAYKQIPLTLAWAITIHKSQGKTFEKVHIELERGAFAEGQVYVALSRCKTLEGITLAKPITKEDVLLNFDVISFYQKISEENGA